MTRVVWKFDIPSRGAAVPGGRIVTMPAQSTFLHCAEQYAPNSVGGYGSPVTEDPTISTWWEVDPSRPNVSRRFQVFGTGHPLDDGTGLNDNLRHLGTTLHFGGSLVLHLYMETTGKVEV